MLRKIITDATQFSRGQKGGDKAYQTRSEEAVESASRYSYDRPPKCGSSRIPHNLWK